MRERGAWDSAVGRASAGLRQRVRVSHAPRIGRSFPIWRQGVAIDAPRRRAPRGLSSIASDRFSMLGAVSETPGPSGFTPRRQCRAVRFIWKQGGVKWPSARNQTCLRGLMRSPHCASHAGLIPDTWKLRSTSRPPSVRARASSLRMRGWGWRAARTRRISGQRLERVGNLFLGRRTNMLGCATWKRTKSAFPAQTGIQSGGPWPASCWRFRQVR